MGAAVGMKGSSTTSGTLGGYLEIDGRSYVLTAAHFVEDAEKNADKNVELSIPTDLILPAEEMHDVLNRWVQTQCREVRARSEGMVIDKSAEKQSDELVPGDIKGDSGSWEEATLSAANNQLLEFSKALKDGPIIIGKHKVHRKGYRESGTLRRLSEQGHIALNEQGRVFMDWALHEATIKGENRHRYRSRKDALLALEPGNRVPEEILCEKTCDLNAKKAPEMHYVGRTSGHRQCTLTSEPGILRKGGKGETISFPYFLMPKGGPVKKDEVAGDSGAWIIRNSDNTVIGQLYGLQGDHKLVFTPINDIIDHIKEVCQTENVHLPGNPRSAREPETQALAYKRPSAIDDDSTDSILLTPPPTPRSLSGITTPILDLPQSPSNDSSIESTGPPTPDSILSDDYVSVQIEEEIDSIIRTPENGGQSEPLRRYIEADEAEAHEIATSSIEHDLSQTLQTDCVLDQCGNTVSRGIQGIEGASKLELTSNVEDRVKVKARAMPTLSSARVTDFPSIAPCSALSSMASIKFTQSRRSKHNPPRRRSLQGYYYKDTNQDYTLNHMALRSHSTLTKIPRVRTF